MSVLLALVLVWELDDEDWVVRENAQRQLTAVCKEQELRWVVAAFATHPSPEVRRRVRRVLEKYDDISGELPYFPRLDYVVLEQGEHGLAEAAREGEYPHGSCSPWDSPECARERDRLSRMSSERFFAFSMAAGLGRSAAVRRAKDAIARERAHGRIPVPN